MEDTRTATKDCFDAFEVTKHAYIHGNVALNGQFIPLNDFQKFPGGVN